MTLGTIDPAAPATRLRPPGWRDPRLWVGLALVAASVVAGALLVGTSGRTAPVWAATGRLGAGRVLTADDVAVRRVRFGDDASARLYFPADRPLPAGLALSRDVGPGELLPRTAVAPAPSRDLRRVPVAVAPDQVPADVGDGDLVDVYLRSAGGPSCTASPGCGGRPVVADVSVVAAPPPDSAFATDGSRMLVLAMSGRQVERFFAALARTEDPAVTVVARG